MLPRQIFRKDPGQVRTMLTDRCTEAPFERLLEVDIRWRELVARVEELKASRNAGSKAIGALFRDGRGEEASELKDEMSRIGAEIAAMEDEANALEEELGGLELTIPNLLAADMPRGSSEEDNVEIRRWGVPRVFDFQPQAHWDLGPNLGLVDFERATKLAGARFAVLFGVGAALERALISLMLDTHTREHGYTEVMTPYLVNAAALEGTGQLPKFAADLFHIQDQNLYLIPTAEVPVTNLHREEILPEGDLPKRYCAFTPCFRAEAGSHGQDVRGLIRQHQFNKVELVQVVDPAASEAALEDLTSHAERILQLLELPYRVMALCSGDIGFSAAKTYDLEVWLPGQERYREISSCSSFTDFQARRMQLRYRPGDGGKARLTHTVNGSGLAVGRTMVAVLENYQQPDGSVVIPSALRPYMGGRETIEPIT